MTRTVTLSLVITSCGGTFRVTVRRSTRTIWSMIGIRQDQARALLGDQPAEPEDHAALVLAQDPDRRSEHDQHEDQRGRRLSRWRLPRGAPSCSRAGSATPRRSASSGSDAERQPLDRLDPHSTAALQARSRPSSGVVVVEAARATARPRRRPGRPGRAARAPRRPRRPSPPSRCASAAPARLRPPARPRRRGSRRAAAPTTITTGAEISNALELVSKSSRPEAISATTPDAPRMPWVGRCASAMIIATPKTSSSDPDGGHRKLRGAVEAEQERDHADRPGHDQPGAEQLDRRSRRARAGSAGRRRSG